MRIDQLLVEKGLCPGRDRAKELIRAGDVSVNGVTVKKPSEVYPAGSSVVVKDALLRYVSRGGFKLEKALDVFSIGLTGKTCMDIGASTGGFTDCMLQRGAGLVYAVDVGSGQLSPRLKTDVRVRDLENTNVRDMDCVPYAGKIEFVSVDVSFLSLAYVLGTVKALLADWGEAVCLIKPQFEAGKGFVGKNGVVKDAKVHERVINGVLASARLAGLFPAGITFSPVKGPQGNIEYLLYLKKQWDGETGEFSVPELVAEAKRALDGKREPR